MVEPMIRISAVIFFSSFLLVGVVIVARPSRNLMLTLTTSRRSLPTLTQSSLVVESCLANY